MRSYGHKILPYLIGLGAGVALLGLYLGIMTLTADWAYARIQFEEYRLWILALATGLGVQSSLLALVKRRLKRNEKGAVVSTLAASGGVSTASMLACCLHHITDIVPVLGLPVLAAAIDNYLTLFFLIGVLSNLFGIAMMLRMMVRHDKLRFDSISRYFTWNFWHSTS